MNPKPVKRTMALLALIGSSTVVQANDEAAAEPLSFFEYLGSMVQEDEGTWLDPLLLVEQEASLEPLLQSGESDSPATDAQSQSVEESR